MPRKPPQTAPASRSRRANSAAQNALEAHCRDHQQRLTPMRRDVFRFLLEQSRPQTAYQVIDGLSLSLQKPVAPLSVYRALDFLVSEGRVHRLESLRAFTVCREPDHHHAGILFVCNRCGQAEESGSAQVEALIQRDAQQRGFLAQRQIVEVMGTCRGCSR